MRSIQLSPDQQVKILDLIFQLGELSEEMRHSGEARRLYRIAFQLMSSIPVCEDVHREAHKLHRERSENHPLDREKAASVAPFSAKRQHSLNVPKRDATYLQLRYAGPSTAPQVLSEDCSYSLRDILDDYFICDRTTGDLLNDVDFDLDWRGYD